jgi:hypothetical protein
MHLGLIDHIDFRDGELEEGEEGENANYCCRARK